MGPLGPPVLIYVCPRLFGSSSPAPRRAFDWVSLHRARGSGGFLAMDLLPNVGCPLVHHYDGVPGNGVGLSLCGHQEPLDLVCPPLFIASSGQEQGAGPTYPYSREVVPAKALPPVRHDGGVTETS